MIDIVTPSLNSELYLEETIVSAKKIREINGRYLVCDSGSSDSTLEILNRHDIAYIYCPPGNMYQAINTGITALNNEWCTYINSDDIIYHRALLRALEKHGEDADIIYGNLDRIDVEGRYLSHWKSSPESTLNEMFASGIMPFGQPGTLFRRCVWSQLNKFHEKYLYASDFDFFMRALLAGFRFKYYSTEALAGFREHNNQMSHRRLSELQSEKCVIMRSNNCKVNYIKKNIAKLRFRAINFKTFLCMSHGNNFIRGTSPVGRTGLGAAVKAESP